VFLWLPSGSVVLEDRHPHQPGPGRALLMNHLPRSTVGTAFLALGLVGVLAACGAGNAARGRAVAVPDLFCLTPDPARAALRGDGLIAVEHLSKSAPAPIGGDMVESQSPAAGRRVAVRTEVTLYATAGTRNETVAECRSYYQRAPSWAEGGDAGSWPGLIERRD